MILHNIRISARAAGLCMGKKGESSMERKAASVRIKEVARESGVSQSTASIVLNGHGDKMRISKATQEKVWNAARDLNYRPRHCTETESGIRRRVGIFWNDKLVDDTMGRFFYGISQGIEKNVYSVELMVQLYHEGALADQKDLLSSGRYEGVIISAPSDEDVAALDQMELDIPVVLANRSSTRYSCVYVDNVEVGRHCADLFASRGYRSVGIIGSAKDSGPSVRRFGFLQECKRQGIEFRREWIQETEDYHISGGYQCAQRILECEELPSGLFVLTDTHAIGVMIALKERGIEIPGQMKLLAYGNNDVFEVMSPRIASVDISREVLAEHTLALLMTKLENGIQDPISRVEIPEYKLRGSF